MSETRWREEARLQPLSRKAVAWLSALFLASPLTFTDRLGTEMTVRFQRV